VLYKYTFITIVIFTFQSKNKSFYAAYLPQSKPSWSNNLLPVVWWTFCLPVNFTLCATIPDCRVKRALYPITFVMSIIWVSVVTYVLSWFLTICGKYKSKTHVHVFVFHTSAISYMYAQCCIYLHQWLSTHMCPNRLLVRITFEI